MEKHTKADIRANLQSLHCQLCKEYKNSSPLEEAEERFLAIHAWWLSSSATTEGGLPNLELWLHF